MRPKMLSALVSLVCLTQLSGLAHAQAGSASKWWWESYNGSGSVQLKSPGTVSATRNPTGDAAQPATTAATQPPTVVIQTQSTASTTTSGMTCANAIHQGRADGYSSLITTDSCPSIPGYSVYPVLIGGHNVPNYTPVIITQTKSQTSAIASCCYVPQGSATSGIAYSPWQDFPTSGYSGSQKQSWTTGSATWTVPQGVYRIWVTAVGGGGGGSVVDGNGSSGGGGGGAIVYRHPVNVTPGRTVSIQVGAGGKGGRFNTSASGGYGYFAGGNGVSTSTAGGGGGGGASHLSYLSDSITACGGGGASTSTTWWGTANGYCGGSTNGNGGSGGGANGSGNSGTNIVYGGGGPSASSMTPGGSGGNSGALGGFDNGYGGYSYTNGGGGGGGVRISTNNSNSAASSQGGNGGGGAGGYGGKSIYSTGPGSPSGNAGGGAAGFIGLLWTTSVPSGGNATGCSSNASGGYGYGAGGGSGVQCTGSPMGGDGADGFVAIEW